MGGDRSIIFLFFVLFFGGLFSQGNGRWEVVELNTKKGKSSIYFCCFQDFYTDLRPIVTFLNHAYIQVISVPVFHVIVALILIHSIAVEFIEFWFLP